MGTEPAAHGRNRRPPVEDEPPLERYADVVTNDGELLVYDVDEEEAWVQADRYRSLEECR